MLGGGLSHSIHPFASVLIVPKADAGVNVTRSNSGDEEQVFAIAENFDVFPLLMRGAKENLLEVEISPCRWHQSHLQGCHADGAPPLLKQ